MRLLLLLLCHITIAVCEEPLGVFLFLGDEGIIGKGHNFDELSEHLNYKQENLVYHNQEWIPISPEYVKKCGLGPEVAFAHRISANKGYRYSDNVGIIKLAKKGSSLDHDWSPYSSAPDALYPKLIKLVQEAKAKREIKILGILWAQGIVDAESPEMTKRYQSNLEKFVTKLREDINNPEAIFITARREKESSPWDDSPPLTVAIAQESVNLDKYRYIDSHGHLVHKLDSYGALIIGRLFSDKMVAEMTFDKYASILGELKYIVRCVGTPFSGLVQTDKPNWLSRRQSFEEFTLEAHTYDLIKITERPTAISSELKKELLRITTASDDKASENHMSIPFSGENYSIYTCFGSDKDKVMIITDRLGTLFCNIALLAGDSIYQIHNEWESVVFDKGLIEMIEAELPEKKTTLSPFQKWKGEE